MVIEFYVIENPGPDGTQPGDHVVLYWDDVRSLHGEPCSVVSYYAGEFHLGTFEVDKKRIVWGGFGPEQARLLPNDRLVLAEGTRNETRWKRCYSGPAPE